MEDYNRLSASVSNSSGAQTQSQGGQMQAQGVEDFPALPRTQPGSLSSLEEQQKSLGRGIGAQQSRLMPHMDNMLGQQSPVSLIEADKKVAYNCSGCLAGIH